MKTKLTLIVVIFFCIAIDSNADQLSITRQMALILANENDHEQSAIEFRRLAAFVTEKNIKAAYYYAAAYEYWKSEKYYLSQKMLDNCETVSFDLTPYVRLLRAECSIAQKQFEESLFYLEGICLNEMDQRFQDTIRTRLTHAHIILKQYENARNIIDSLHCQKHEAIDAFNHYINGKDKKAWVGGFLGLIPGLGYAYSKEYANALRSLIMNSLFIYGQIDCARNEQWGFFAVISFFELTWYSGSIYGGIDAAHRYNNNRLKDFLEVIYNNNELILNYKRLPSISFQYNCKIDQQ